MGALTPCKNLEMQVHAIRGNVVKVQSAICRGGIINRMSWFPFANGKYLSIYFLHDIGFQDLALSGVVSEMKP